MFTLRIGGKPIDNEGLILYFMCVIYKNYNYRVNFSGRVE